MSILDLHGEIQKLRAKAAVKRFCLNCLKCGEPSVKLLLKEDDEVSFGCEECGEKMTIWEVDFTVREWVNVIAWVASYGNIEVLMSESEEGK